MPRWRNCPGRRQCWWCAMSATMWRHGRRPRSLVARRCAQRYPLIARPRKWAPKTRCSSSTPRARTGKPKGVLHTTGGYLTWAAMTHQLRVRLPSRRGLLVRGRCRLGHRAQLCRLWPAGQRRDHGDVRRRAELSRPTAASGRSSTATRSDIFYGAPTALRALMREGDDWVKTDQPHLAAPARLGRRTDQSRGVGMVLARGRRRALPDRRHLVADRNRRPA